MSALIDFWSVWGGWLIFAIPVAVIGLLLFQWWRDREG